MAETKAKTTKPKPTKALEVYVGEERVPVATSFEAQVDLLAESTPPKYVMNRPGRGGTVLDYVEANYVMGRLNATFMCDWDVEIVDKIIDTKSNQIAMWVRLTARFLNGKVVRKDAWGSAEIKRKSSGGEIIDLGDDLKAAQSDGIKKAASMLGICWDVYGGYTKNNGNKSKHKQERKPAQDDFLDAEIISEGNPEAAISDIADEIAGDEAHRDEVVEQIKLVCEERALDYKDFKSFLFDIQDKKKRAYVGLQFGNLSLTAGKTADLELLLKHIDEAVSTYLNDRQGKEASV